MLNIKSLRPICLLAFSLVLAAGLLACGGDDNGNGNGGPDPATAIPEEERAPVEAAVRSLIDAYNRGDFEAFLDGWTEEALIDEYGASREELLAAAQDFFGGPERHLRELTTTGITGDTATVEAEFSLGRSLSREQLTLRQEEGAWKLAGTNPLQPELDSDTEAVEVEMGEFVFRYDASRASDGDFAFRALNTGSQAHELALVKIPESADVQQLLQQAATSPDLPEGVEVIGGVAPVAPGQEGWLAFTEPLEPGRYLMACFLPDTIDPELTPHSAKGMTSEFNVTTAGGGR